MGISDFLKKKKKKGAGVKDKEHYWKKGRSLTMSSDYQSSKKADVFVDSSGTKSAEYCNKF